MSRAPFMAGGLRRVPYDLFKVTMTDIVAGVRRSVDAAIATGDSDHPRDPSSEPPFILTEEVAHYLSKLPPRMKMLKCRVPHGRGRGLDNRPRRARPSNSVFL